MVTFRLLAFLTCLGDLSVKNLRLFQTCACVKMFEMLDDIEVFLNDECGAVFSKNKLKFFRVHRNHHQGDYTCIIRNNLQNVDMPSELFEKILKEKKPLWKDFLKFSLTDGRASIFLNRTFCFTNGLKSIHDLGEFYGSNNLNNKIFSVTLDKSFELNSITYLRGKIVTDILQQLIKISGGTLHENEENPLFSSKPYYKIIVTNKFSREPNDDKCIFTKVGSVLTGIDSDKKQVTLDEYYKLRSEEVNSMCEYKLEKNNVTKNRDDLIRATIFFDMIQSNIHKSMTLLLGNQNPDIKTSFKGALFVMYNYVRLVSLIAKFDYLVSSKKYLPLPPQDEVDFSLLSLEAEWALMYDYVLNWPSVVRRSFENFEDGCPKIHNICTFLIHFSSEFSVYYHRTRILTDPRTHIMSVLYARIYFLKAIAQVFKNALKLILLSPVNKM